MIVYSKKSQAIFDSLDPRLQKVLLYIKDVLEIDHSLLCGHRGKEEQDKAYLGGNSKVQWPNSKHNTYPSLAVDVVPYIRLGSAKGGVHWHNEDQQIRENYYRDMVRLATIIQMVAKLVFQTELRWGGDFNKNWVISDQNWLDFPHIEVVE